MNPPILARQTDELALAEHVGLHNRPRPETVPVKVVLIGHSGQVGSALLRRLTTGSDQRSGPTLNLVEAFNRQYHLRFERDGLRQSPRNESDFAGLTSRLKHQPGPGIVVDCSADAQLPDHYPGWLAAGIAVVTPNKQGLAGNLARYRQIQAAASAHQTPLRYSATVGAGLPILSTLQRAARAGQRPSRIEAVLSGTLVHVFSGLHQGMKFSQVVAQAHRLGLTEPNPLQDLSGQDVARKLNIMLREAQLGDLPILRKPLVDDDLAHQLSRKKDVFQALEALDESWENRIAQAQRRGQRLVYLARFDGKQARSDHSWSMPTVALQSWSAWKTWPGSSWTINPSSASPSPPRGRHRSDSRRRDGRPG
jgi:homoserine dehydrogenase